MRKLAPGDVFSMLEVLAGLEKLGGTLAAERASDSGIRAVLDIHAEMLALYERRDRLAYYKLNQDIHTRIAALSQNAMLAEVQANIQARLKRIRFIGNRTPTAWAEAVAEHEEMAAALAARDGERLGEILARHLRNTWARVQDVV